MNPMVIGLLAGAGLGMLKGQQDDKAYGEAKKESDRINAVKARYSPWTGIRPNDFNQKAPSMMGSIMQGGMAGGMFGQGFAEGPADLEVGNAYADNNAQYSASQQGPMARPRTWNMG